MKRHAKLIKVFGIKANIQSFNTFLGADLLRCPMREFDEAMSNVTLNDVIRFRAYCENDGESDTYDLIAA